jgi:hypothetical protein
MRSIAWWSDRRLASSAGSSNAGGTQRLEQGAHPVDELLDHTAIVIRPVPGRRM